MAACPAPKPAGALSGPSAPAQDLQPQLRATVAGVADLMARIEADRVAVVQPKAAAVAADEAAAQAQARTVTTCSGATALHSEMTWSVAGLDLHRAAGASAGLADATHAHAVPSAARESLQQESSSAEHQCRRRADVKKAALQPRGARRRRWRAASRTSARRSWQSRCPSWPTRWPRWTPSRSPTWRTCASWATRPPPSSSSWRRAHVSTVPGPAKLLFVQALSGMPFTQDALLVCSVHVTCTDHMWRVVQSKPQTGTRLIDVLPSVACAPAIA